MVSGTLCTHRADKCSGQFFILKDGTEEKANIERDTQLAHRLCCGRNNCLGL